MYLGTSGEENIGDDDDEMISSLWLGEKGCNPYVKSNEFSVFIQI